MSNVVSPTGSKPESEQREQQELRLRGQEHCREGLERRTGDLDAVGGVRAVVLDNGAERGIRVLEFRTGGGLRFEVLIDRAMDIGVAEFDDYSFGWRSVVGFRHPSLHDANDELGLSWLRSMSGLLITCGLDHTLSAGDFDASNYAYPQSARPVMGCMDASRRVQTTR